MGNNTKILLAVFICVFLTVRLYQVLDARLDYLDRWMTIKAIRSTLIEYRLNKLEHGVHSGSN